MFLDLVRVAEGIGRDFSLVFSYHANCHQGNTAFPDISRRSWRMIVTVLILEFFDCNLTEFQNVLKNESWTLPFDLFNLSQKSRINFCHSIFLTPPPRAAEPRLHVAE